MDNFIIKATSDLFIATLLSAAKNESILCGLINAVLKDSGQPLIKKATVLNPFNIKEFAVDKRIVLDVRVEDEQGRFYNIEVQTTPHPAFVERILLGWADTYSSQLHAGNEYQRLRPVFCIVITEFKIIDEIDSAHLIFELREQKRPEIVLSGHLQMHFLQLYDLRSEILDGVTPELRHWLNFLVCDSEKKEEEMAQLVENDPIIMAAMAELHRFASDPEKREWERRHKLWKLDYYSGLAASRDEGFAEGEARGEARGIAEGEAKGKAGALAWILSKRFPNEHERVRDRILALRDLEKIDQLTDISYDCSFAEFEKRCQEPF